MIPTVITIKVINVHYGSHDSNPASAVRPLAFLFVINESNFLTQAKA